MKSDEIFSEEEGGGGEELDSNLRKSVWWYWWDLEESMWMLTWRRRGERRIDRQRQGSHTVASGF